MALIGLIARLNQTLAKVLPVDISIKLEEMNTNPFSNTYIYDIVANQK